ncbi:hypothetical protein JHK84_048006 [Glycine max]|nr:hypothetical protein JHK85_048588 [Glycine max]KAG5103037.1 hypothetical protein JHK84_048006 [Glycine max]
MERFLWLAYATGLSRWRCDRLCVEVTTCKTCCYSLRLLNDIRASTLTSSTNESSLEHNYHGSNKLRLGSVGTVAAEKVAMIELLFPSIFRAVLSWHPVGSMDPDAVAFFALDEIAM